MIMAMIMLVVVVVDINDIGDSATQGGNLVRPCACYVQRDPFPCRKDAGFDQTNYDDGASSVHMTKHL